MELKQRIENLEAAVKMATINTKEVLTFDEAAKYLGMSKSYLYKLTSTKRIPHYKPTGKMNYFNRIELDQWLQANRVSTEVELSQKAQSYCMKGGLR